MGWSFPTHKCFVSEMVIPHMFTMRRSFFVYGREASTLPQFLPRDTKISDLDEILQEREAILCALHDNLHVAQTKMKEQADKHKRDVEFSVGDMVFLKLQP